MLKYHNRNTRTRWEISPKLAIKTSEWYYWLRSDVFISCLYIFNALLQSLYYWFWAAHVTNLIYPIAERRHSSTVFNFNFEHISHLVLVLLLLILSMYLIAGFDIVYSRKDFHEVECTPHCFLVKIRYIYYKL